MAEILAFLEEWLKENEGKPLKANETERILDSCKNFKG